LSNVAYIDSQLINDESQDVKEEVEYIEKNKNLIKNIKLNKYSIGLKRSFTLVIIK